MPSAVRQRKAKQPQSEPSTLSPTGKPSLARHASWHEAATEHVMSRRRYALLFGVLIGIASVAAVQFVYLEKPLPDMMSLPKEQVQTALLA